jgi:hypothetical protein
LRVTTGSTSGTFTSSGWSEAGIAIDGTAATLSRCERRVQGEEIGIGKAGS